MVKRLHNVNFNSSFTREKNESLKKRRNREKKIFTIIKKKKIKRIIPFEWSRVTRVTKRPFISQLYHPSIIANKTGVRHSSSPTIPRRYIAERDGIFERLRRLNYREVTVVLVTRERKKRTVSPCRRQSGQYNAFQLIS